MRALRVVISGCSGGGKSTLLEALARRGYATVAEPGRRIIASVADPASAVLPWNDLAGFATAAVAMAREDFARHRGVAAPVFFDRGLIDALVAHRYATGTVPAPDIVAACRYDETVFLVPPWPDIYTADADRRHGFAEAVSEYRRLAAAYPAFGYRVNVLARAPVEVRADAVLGRLGLPAQYMK